MEKWIERCAIANVHGAPHSTGTIGTFFWYVSQMGNILKLWTIVNMSKMHIKLKHENSDNKTVEMMTKPKKVVLKLETYSKRIGMVDLPIP